MPTIEGKEGRAWIDAYVHAAGKLEPVAKLVRALVAKTAVGCEEYVSPWKTPAFDWNGPLCVFVVGKEHVTLAFLRGALLPDPEKLLEGKGKGVRKALFLFKEYASWLYGRLSGSNPNSALLPGWG